MLRLSTPGNTRLFNLIPLTSFYGGGEANVAVSLANYGHDAYYVTKLPKHEIGQSAVNALRRYGVHTDYIARGGNRVGIYYLETGASMRASKVIYDRAGSSIAEASVDDFDFDTIMEGADWFHWSGITPAISANGAALTKAACIAAKKHGVTVSCDLNYRKKLWTPAEAQAVMKDLMQYVDVCIGNEEDAELCLGFKPEGTDVSSGKLDLNGYTLTNDAGSHTITNKGTLTIIDSVGTGIVDNVSHGKGALVNNGTVTLKSGKLTRSAEAGKTSTDNGGNSWYVVDNNGGKMTVEGGEIVATGKFSSLIRNLNAEFNMKGGHLEKRIHRTEERR